MRVTEIHASTRPYPHWWTDVEETRVLRRRKSSIDEILERNLCFVDTPGYVEGSSEQEDMNLVVEYLESLLHQTASVTKMDDAELIGVISGSGGILVDVVLYMLPPGEYCAYHSKNVTDNFKTRTLPRTSSSCSDFLRSPMSFPSSQNRRR
jgi:hypothetical protein